MMRRVWERANRRSLTPAPHRPQISSQTQISEIDTLMYFKPFLSIIQSDQTSGARPGQTSGRAIRLSLPLSR